MSPGNQAVVLLSGGLDSATVLAVAVSQGHQCHCLTVEYGQRHRQEIDAARKVAGSFSVASHRVVSIDLRSIGGSALTDDIAVPKNHVPGAGPIPVTYVPARNTIFLSLALALAERLSASVLFIGANAVDYSGYPDCRSEFLQSFAALAGIATRAGVEQGVVFRVEAPLLKLSKAEIISLGTELGVDYSLTLSCYEPDTDSRACGHCDSCQLRRRGFSEAGIADPTIYV